MSSYTAHLNWQRKPDEVFTDNRYSRAHSLHFDGGVVLAASSSPHVVPLPMSDASAVDPEEMFVASLASCHMLWFLSIAAGRGFQVDRYLDDASGTLAPEQTDHATDKRRRLVMTEVVLRPQVVFAGAKLPGTDELQALHHEAHEACFIANSVKTVVRCEPRG
jgi:organic hydroperoxide reductase OsmC/OhrA